MSLFKNKTLINKIGVELEGFSLCGDEYKEKYKDLKFSYDGSINPAYEDEDIDRDDFSCDEFKFLITRENEEMELKKIEDFFYFYKQNGSCGNHIHISFNKKIVYDIWAYSMAQMSFLKSYQNRYRNSLKHIKRLENEYCIGNYAYRRVFAQLINRFKDSSRYAFINLNSIKEYQTIEFRIMPHCYRFKEWIDQTKWLVDTVERISTTSINLKIQDKALI